MTAASVAVSMAALRYSAGAPVSPDRETARRWALEELAGREYADARPSPAAELVQWLLGQIRDALSRLPGNDSPLLAALTGVAVLVAILLVVRLVTGSIRRTSTRRGDGDLFGGVVRSATEHRAAAAAAAAAGDWRLAIQEMFRATARSLEERTILDNRPGRTAAEVAQEAGVELPAAARELTDAATVFDDVTYGERPGTPGGYRTVVTADELAARSKPAMLLTT